LAVSLAAARNLRVSRHHQVPAAVEVTAKHPPTPAAVAKAILLSPVSGKMKAALRIASAVTLALYRVA